MWEEEDKERALLLNPLVPLHSWSLELFVKLVRNMDGAEEKTEHNYSINTHWQFSMHSKHLSFETCQEQSNYTPESLAFLLFTSPQVVACVMCVMHECAYVYFCLL